MSALDFFALGFVSGAVGLYLLPRWRLQPLAKAGRNDAYQITTRPPDPPPMRVARRCSHGIVEVFLIDGSPSVECADCHHFRRASGETR